MLKFITLAGWVLLLGLPSGALATTTEAAAPLTAYLGATLVDPALQPPAQRAGLLVQDGRILRWLPSGEAPPDAAVQVDLGGRFIVPGLIDSHVHLTHGGDRAYAERELQRQLHGGVTTVRSMADDTRILGDLARSTLLELLPGPDIVYAALFAGPSFFGDSRVQLATQGVQAGAVPWMTAIDRRTDIRGAVTLARGAGASGIKIYANLAPDLVRRIVREARRQGLQVWAHAAVFPAAPDMLGSSGAHSLSHVCMLAYQAQAMPLRYAPRADVEEQRFATGIPQEVSHVFALMRRHEVVLDATNMVYKVIEDMRARMPEGRGPPIYCSSALAYRLSRAAHAAGVTIAAGTDAPSAPEDPLPALHQELDILVEQVGFTPLEALRAATTNGAKALGRTDLGGLQPGMLANFVVLGSDPLQDIGALRRIQQVVKRGRAYPRSDLQPESQRPHQTAPPAD